MLKKFLASTATVLLAASMSVVSFAMPAGGTGTDTPTDVVSTPAPVAVEVTPAPVDPAPDVEAPADPAPEVPAPADPAPASVQRVAPTDDTYSDDEETSTPTPNPTYTDEAECIPRSAVSYTYDPATNSGAITVAEIPGSTGLLCDDFFVTATSWNFATKGNMWPQVLDQTQKQQITGSGVYEFAAVVTCGQGDIYASYTVQPDPTPILNGPSDPFPEVFLHNMHFSTLTPDQPTYMVDDTNCTIEDPDATVVVGACVYTDGVAAARAVSITFDNSGSNVPVEFKVPYFSQYDQVVPARATEINDAADMYPLGGSYEVTAGGKTFTLVIEPCLDIPRPDGVRAVPVDTVDCASKTVTVTTTTYVTPYTFNSDTLKWEKGVEGAGVVTVSERPLTAEEKAANCEVTPTDPTASTCAATDQTKLTSWIRVGMEKGIVYTIDGTVVTSQYTAATAGTHKVKAAAADGFVLASETETEWDVTVVDTAKCSQFPTLALVNPTLSSTQMTCTTAGSYTIGALDPGTVAWTANGVTKAPGTYAVSSAQTVTLIASAVRTSDSLDPDWKNPKALVFAASTGTCELTTLALTGSANTGALALGGGILIVGIGALLIARRRTGTAS